MSSQDQERILPWRVLDSELALDTPWARVRKDHCALPHGREIADYYYWEGGDFVIVFALTQEQELVLVKQYRHGAHEVAVELPAGLIDIARETPMVAAQRELREETGYSGGDWTLLDELNVSAGKATTRAHVFLARGLIRRGAQELDRNEDIQVITTSLKDFAKLVKNGVIHDAPTLAAAFLAMQTLREESVLTD